MGKQIVKWSDDEVAELLELVAENGQADGIRKFSEKTGRTVDGIRRKLNYLRKKDSETLEELEGTECADCVETEYNVEYVDPEELEREPGTETYGGEKICLLSRLWRWIIGQ